MEVTQKRNRQRQRDLGSIVADGVFFSVMLGLGEAYLPAFALAVGFDAVVAGLLATLPMLLGALFQLVTPLAVRRLRSYRRWVVLCAALQALSFLPLVAGAAQGSISLVWLALAATAYWSFGMATSPAWNAWVTSLVPRRVRARFFATRTRAAQLALLAAVATGGLALHAGRSSGAVLPVFAGLFAIAMLARLGSAVFLARQSEAAGLAERHRTLALREILASIRRAGSGRILLYLVAMQAAVNIAAPFFTPYMLGPLGLSYLGFMSLTAASFVSRIAVLPLLGRLAQRRGTRVVLWLGAVGIVPLPPLWLVSHEFLYLLTVQLYAGVAWAALELATALSFFEHIEESDRASVLSVFNLLNAAAITVGAVLGSELFAQLGALTPAYGWLFVVSALARLAGLLALRGVPVTLTVLNMRFRTLAIRPSAGAVERPILASLGSEASGDEPD